MKNLVVILIFALALQNAAEAQCYATNITYKDGEDINYIVWYKLGPIWLEAGKVRFLADSTTYNGKPAWNIKSYGTSYENWDSFFKVRDFYEVYMEHDMLRPLEFTRQNYEAGWTVFEQYKFDHQKQLIYSTTENSDKKRTCDTLAMKPCTHDLLTAILYARNLDFSKYAVNQKIPVMIVIDAGFYPLYLRFQGKEKIADKNGVEYNCLKFSVMLIEGTMFNQGENMTVWVTDDGNHIPVLIEASILVGSIKAYLSSYKNLRFPFDAKVK